MLDPRHLLAEDLVDDAPRFLEDVRILEQQIGREGQQPARGLVAGDQEGDHLIADVLVAQLLAGDGIDAVEHQIEKVVLLVALRIATPLGDEFARDLVHQLLVGLELTRLGQHEAAEKLRPARAVRGLLQRSHHGGNEGMHVVLVEAVEPVVERTEGDRIEREPRHVVGDLDDGARPEPLPAHEHLVGDVEHPVEHAADGDRPERRDQDAMGLRPVGLVAIGREQPVAGNRADFLQGPLDALAEARLVAQFVHKLLRARDMDIVVHDRELEERPVGAGEPHEALNRAAALQLCEIADDGFQGRLGNRLIQRHDAMPSDKVRFPADHRADVVTPPKMACRPALCRRVPVIQERLSLPPVCRYPPANENDPGRERWSVAVG